MELLEKYGTEAQKQQWLVPLLEGRIRSAFLMTEPDIAASDARNIRCDIHRDGDGYVLNGSVCYHPLDLCYSDQSGLTCQKWWSSDAGDPTCELYIVMGQTTNTSSENPYGRHSVVLVPTNTPGITVHRMLSVYGYDDAPHGHGHITLKNVRVPASSIVLGEGRGFEIIQGRLGPGRIHHAMRTIGAAESALEWMIARVNDERKAFRPSHSAHAMFQEWIAKSRIEIDAARMTVLNAAVKIDQEGAKAALREIAMAKVLVPHMALQVIDRAVQAFGAAGVCQDTPLPGLWASARTIRIVDGPDEVHLQQLGRRESQRMGEAVRKDFVGKARRLIDCCL